MKKCPICKSPVAPRLENPFFPFCSKRCSLIDLGKWLGEDYRVPDRKEETEDATFTPRESDDDGNPS